MDAMVSYGTSVKYSATEANILIGLVLILPLLGAGGLWLMRDRPARLHWAVSVAFALLPVIGIGALGLRLPLEFSFSSWRPADLFQAVLLLRLDTISWPLALAAAAMPLSIFLCAPSRPDSTNPAMRALTLAYVGLSIVGVMAANTPTVIMAWLAADIVGFLSLLGAADSAQTVRGGYRRFLTHVASVVLVLAGSLPLESELYSAWSQAFWVLAVAFRLGLWPLHVAMPEMPGVRRGLGVVMRLLPPLMGLAFLARFSAGQIPGPLIGWLLSLAVLSVIFGGLRWAVASDPINARPYFVLTLAGMAIAAVAGSQDSQIVIIGIAGMMALAGTAISQLMVYQTWHRYLLITLVGFAAGIPFTIGHAGHLLGIGQVGPAIADILASSLIALGFGAVILGIGRSLNSERHDWVSGESFVRNAYSAGLLVPIFVMLITGIGLRVSPTNASLISLLLSAGMAALGWYVLGRMGSRMEEIIESSTQIFNESVESSVAGSIRLLLSTVSGVLRWVGQFFEGKAGLLWIYVVLLLVGLLVAGTGG